jgi:hypothetical protein
MSESEKKGSAWPWIAVPVAAVSLFFVLRECQHRLPPSERAAPAVTVPAAPDTSPSDPQPQDPAATPAPAPAPQ